MKKRIRRNAGRLTRQAGKPDLRGQADRDGSVIVVVLALLIGLLFLGILLLTDSSQEEINAEYFADSAKVNETNLDPETLFSNILRQIILGANTNEKHSPFYGGRMSLLPTMYGSDGTLFNGEGVRIVYDATNGYYVDNDYDGVPDPGTTNWKYLNNSCAAYGADPAAPATPDLTTGALAAMPQPDVGYVYPDWTSLFLAYQGQAPHFTTLAGADGVQTCIIPSYLRPQLLRNVTTPDKWYTDPLTARLVCRPHREHRAILRNGAIAIDMATGQPVRRFISAAVGTPTYGDATVMPFPFPVDEDANNNNILDAGEDLNGNGKLDRLFGLWSGPSGTATPTLNPYAGLDSDLDGDGINDSIYMDMDLGVYTTPDGSKKFVPIVSLRLVSLDALINLDKHGNLARALQANGTVVPLSAMMVTPPTSSGYLHKSNTGVRRSEINPQWGLLANPVGAVGDPFEQHRIYYNSMNPATIQQLANQEYFWLMTGRPQYQGSKSNILSLYPGLYGEPNLMKQASANPYAPTTAYPRPGQTGVDDNGDQFLGGVYASSGVFPIWAAPTQFVFPRFVHPNDYRGAGQFYSDNTRRLLANVQRHVFAAYSNYFTYQMLWPSLTPDINFVAPFTPIANTTGSLLVDDEAELRVDVPQAADSIFTAAETASLHMSDSDLNAVGRLGDRILALAPYNFKDSPIAGTIRRLFTTESWDVPSYGNTFYKTSYSLPPASAARFRNWEFTNQTINGVPNVAAFPPGSATDPFRPEVRELLWSTISQSFGPLQRRLSVNGILDRNPTTGQLRFRPLTPHVVGVDATGNPLLDSQPVSGTNSVLGAARFTITQPELIDPGGAGNTLGTRQRQEWLARRDRQQKCRDIYTLLYMFGGGGDGFNYSTQANASPAYPVHSAQQLKAMAQFAVNLVDSLDPDNVVTAFEYDTDLSDGWGLDDDPYTADPAEPAVANSQRGVVFGVEAQLLTFSEALTVLAKRTNMGMTDHTATEFDDKKHRLFTWFELQNVSPFQVNFNSNWQVRVVPGTVSGTPVVNVVEKRVTLDAGNVVPAATLSDTASRFTVGTHNDTSYMDPADATKIAPSFFKVDPDNAGGTKVVLAPYLTPLGLDLMRSPTSYHVNDAPMTASAPQDGTLVSPNTAADPAGKTLLTFGDPTMAGAPPSDGTLDGVMDKSVNVRFQLCRRQNLNRAAPTDQTLADQANDNPWVVVDQMEVPLRVFQLQDSSATTADLQNQLKLLLSNSRTQPLDGNNQPEYAIVAGTDAVAGSPLTFRLNRLGTANQATDRDPNLPTNALNVKRFSLWQPHFDRDFASAAELLGLPLYGPDQLTRNLGTLMSPYKINLASTAAPVFLRPDLTAKRPEDTLPGTPANPENRWYRLFELMEVPDRNPTSSPWYVDTLGRFNGLAYPRTPGKMALNTMSHPSLLAALLDDPDLLTLNVNNAPPFLRDNIDLRDWWAQFLLSRDGLDPITGYALPGVPGTSRPFQPLSHVVNDASGSPTPYTSSSHRSMEQTVLRSLPQDAGVAGNAAELTARRLFELGANSGQNPTGGWSSDTKTDVTTRYRLLNKVLNHTTNRSNVFVLTVKIDFFEATEVTVSNPSFVGEKAVRIGAKLPGTQNPGYLAYYVIDRTKAATLLQQKDLPEQNQEGVAGRFSWRFRQDMDFSPLILHKQRIK
jgi:hypothetical protein